MPSFTEIYSSLIENPDIQPPEGQDRDAYVVDLAKQRLRQHQNNEKALSLGISKSAIDTFSDWVIRPLRKSMPTTPLEIFADFLLKELKDDIMDERSMNSIVNSVDPQIANAVLSQYSAKDLKTKETRVQALADMEELQLYNNTRLEESYYDRLREHEEEIQRVRADNKDIAEWNKDRPSAQQRSLRSAGNPPTKPQEKTLIIPGEEIKALVNKKMPGKVEDLLDHTKKGGKRFNQWGSEVSWLKHVGYEPSIPKPSVDDIGTSSTEAQTREEQSNADKSWELLNNTLKEKLEYHLADTNPSIDWDNLDINDPKYTDPIINALATGQNGDAASKDIKRFLDDTGGMNRELSSEFDKFMSNGFGSKFFETRSDLYDGGKDEQDGVRTLIGEHFKDKKLTSTSLKRMSTQELRDIFEEAGYANAEKLHPAVMKQTVASIFPSQITNPKQFEVERDTVAKKIADKWSPDNLKELYSKGALEMMRESFPEMSDDDLVALARVENAHDESPNKGNIGGTNAKGRKVSIGVQNVKKTDFQNRHSESLGIDFIEVENIPQQKETAVYDGINEDHPEHNWDGGTQNARDYFNQWRQNALDLLLQDAGAFGSSEQGQVLDDLYERVSKETGLPKSLVAVGSDEHDTENHMTAEMRQAIHNSMRSNIILHAERKEIPNREVPEGKEPDHTAEALEVTPADLEPHYENAIAESQGLSTSMRDTRIKMLEAYIAENNYAEMDQQGLGRTRQSDQQILAKIRLRGPRQQGEAARNEIRQEAGDFNYQLPTEQELKEVQTREDLDTLMGTVKDAEQKETSSTEESSASSGDPNEVGRSAVNQLSDEAKKRQEEAQAKKDEEDAAGNEEESDAPTPIQYQGEDAEYGTSLVNDQFVRDTNGDLYVVDRKGGTQLSLTGVDEDGKIRSSGNRTVNVDPSSDEYDKENEYFRHEIDGQSTRYNLDRVNKGLDPLQINESDEENMGKNEEGDPLPAIPDRVRDYLKEAGHSDEEIKSLFDTNELHYGDGNSIPLQTIKEKFPIEQQEGGEEPSSEASGMENIKNLIIESDEVKDSVKERVKEAKNINEINTAVSKENAPVNIEAIPSLPLTPATLTSAMRLGLFDLEGNPTPRGDHFLNMVGEAMPDIQEMMNTDDFKDAYKEKYTKTRFNPVRSLSKVAFNNIIRGWNNMHDEDNQIAWGESDWDQETTQVTKMNGDPLDDDFYTKEFTFGDDAPHLKKAMWGGEESEHNVFSRMLMSGIIAGRLGNAGQDEWEELMTEGSLFKGRITQVNGDDVSNREPINNDDLHIDEVVADMEDFAGGIPAGEESENFIDDFGVIQNPSPNIEDFAGGSPAGQVVEEDESTEDAVEESEQAAATVPTSAASGGGGTPPPETTPTATSGDSGGFQEPRTPSSKGTPPKETTSKKEDQINSLMVAQFDENWKDQLKDNAEIKEQHDHFTEMDDKQFTADYTQHMKIKRDARIKAKGEAAKAQTDADTKAQRATDSETDAEQGTLDGMDDDSLAVTEKRDRQVKELIESDVLPESAHKYLKADHPDARSNKEINALHNKHVVEPSFTSPPVEEDVPEEEPMAGWDGDRERYYQELADYDGIDLETAKKRYAEDGTYSDDDFKKKVNTMFNKPKKESEQLDREGLINQLAELRNESPEDIKAKFEHSDDKQIQNQVNADINREHNDKVNEEKSDKARVGKQNARDANASLKHRFKTPMEVKNEFDPKRERAGEDGEMATSEAADMFRSLLQHASQNHNHYDDAGIERLNELNHNLVRHLENSPEGIKELDKIHSEVQMASDLDIEYGSDNWYKHLDKTEADRAEKETREREDIEADRAEANRQFDDRETALDRAFAHPHNKDHSNRLHSFDLEIEIGEDGKPTVTNAEHKGGIHHFEHSDGVVREHEHDAASHRGSGRSEHAPHDPDHTPAQAEIYQRVHAHRQRMDDLESPIRETDRRHSKEKSDLQAKFDEVAKKRAKSHGRTRTGIQEKMGKQHSELTEAYDKDMESLSADLDDVTGSNQDQMDALREQKKADYRELARRHNRNASTAKERMNASESAMTDQQEKHTTELDALDTEHEQDRTNFDSGAGKWDLDEMQRTNPEAAERYADAEQREAVKQELYDSHASTRAELENTHADRMESMENFHAENKTSHDDITTQHADEQEEFERTSKDDVQKLQGEIVRATKEIRSKINQRTDDYKESSDKISAEANDGYEKLDKYVDATEAEYQTEHNTNKEALTSKHTGEKAEAVGSAGNDMLEASKADGMLREEYLNSAGDDEAAKERMTSNLDNSDLGATENSHARHAEEESTRIQGEAQEAAQGMMDEDTPPPGSPSPTNANLVYKPGPGKNWVTRDSYQAAVAKGLLARNNNSISFSNQGGNIFAHHGTDSWEVNEGVEGKGARTSQESVGNAIHHGASSWSDEDGTSFTDRASSLKEGESFEISQDHFKNTSPALVRGLKGQKPDNTTPTTDDTSTETGETSEEPQGASSKFLGRMGTKVFSPAAQALKQSASKAKQDFANDLRSSRWVKNNMSATGEGADKRYKSGFMSSHDPHKDHVGEASLGREMSRFNPFKGQQTRASISTENQVENQSRAVQALSAHVQGQNKTLAQMGGQTAPTVKPTVGASTQTLQDHVKNKQSAGTTPPPPTAT